MLIEKGGGEESIDTTADKAVSFLAYGGLPTRLENWGGMGGTAVNEGESLSAKQRRCGASRDKKK